MKNVKRAVNSAYAIAALVAFGAMAMPANAQMEVDNATCYKCDSCTPTGVPGELKCSGCVQVPC